MTSCATGIIYCQNDFSAPVWIDVFCPQKSDPKVAWAPLNAEASALTFVPHTKTIFQAQGKSHLITSNVKPLYILVQRHDLVDHGFDQRPRLLLVWVEGVGKHLHLPEMGELLVLQHELQEKGELREHEQNEGDSSVLLCHQRSNNSCPSKTWALAFIRGKEYDLLRRLSNFASTN